VFQGTEKKEELFETDEIKINLIEDIKYEGFRHDNTHPA
jgi:hypothetical protein